MPGGCHGPKRFTPHIIKRIDITIAPKSCQVVVQQPVSRGFKKRYGRHQCAGKAKSSHRLYEYLTARNRTADHEIRNVDADEKHERTTQGVGERRWTNRTARDFRMKV